MLRVKAASHRKSRLQLIHQYYQYTGFYDFLGSTLRKALTPLLLLISSLLVIHYLVIDLNELLGSITTSFSTLGILLTFFASESILGLIPPEIFIAWSDGTSQPLFYLCLIALLSYLGGVVSYFIGNIGCRIPSVHRTLELRMAKHLKNTRKWGGFLIVVGALLPVPFSLTSMAAGMIKFPFLSFLSFGLLRIVRIFIYAAVIFNVV
ncbi:YqaA family protein [Croceiramulus getboli]|nr:short-chain dehydrogenase [Flavobacteriaceae bacterium YJPT1-3]